MLIMWVMEAQKEQETKTSGFWSIQDLSSYLAIKTGKLYAMVGERKTPHYKVGRLVRFKKSEIDRWMEGNRKECVDPERAARKALGPVRRPKIDIDRVVRKVIDGTRGQGYTKSHGKTRPSQGPREGGS